MLLHCFYLFFTLISQIKSASVKLPSYKEAEFSDYTSKQLIDGRYLIYSKNYSVHPFISKTTTDGESEPQKIFKIKLDYITDGLCNNAGKGVLKEKIIDALQELNKVMNLFYNENQDSRGTRYNIIASLD